MISSARTQPLRSSFSNASSAYVLEDLPEFNAAHQSHTIHPDILPSTSAQNLVNGAIGFGPTSIEGILSLEIPETSKSFEIESISLVLYGQEIVSANISRVKKWKEKQREELLFSCKNAEDAKRKLIGTDVDELDLDVTPTPTRVELLQHRGEEEEGVQFYEEESTTSHDDNQSEASEAPSENSHISESSFLSLSSINGSNSIHLPFFVFQPLTIYSFSASEASPLTLNPGTHEYPFKLPVLHPDVPGTFHSPYGSIEYRILIMVQRKCTQSIAGTVTHRKSVEIAVPRFHPLSVFQPASERIVSNSDSFTYFKQGKSSVTSNSAATGKEKEEKKNIVYDFVVPRTIISLYGESVDLMIHLSHIDEGVVKGLIAEIVQITEVGFEGFNKWKIKSKREVLGRVEDVQSVNGQYWKKMISIPLTHTRNSRPTTHIPTSIEYPHPQNSPESPSSTSWGSLTNTPSNFDFESLRERQDSINSLTSLKSLRHSRRASSPQPAKERDPYIPHIIVRHELNVNLIVTGISNISALLGSLNFDSTSASSSSRSSSPTGTDSWLDRIKSKHVLGGSTLIPVATVPLVFHGLSDEARDFIATYVNDPKDEISKTCLRQITYRIRK
ncbi:hypothetical protein HK098_001774 [Nowakowskiella sp. JEL0407]|nr:hypothetical protein HK098_001774 [Nowakowskiella sp. JEL0407]